MPDQGSKVDQWYSLAKTFSIIKTTRRGYHSDSESSESSSGSSSNSEVLTDDDFY